MPPYGSLLVAQMTKSTDVPITPGVIQPYYAGDELALGHGGSYGGDADAFVMKLVPAARS